VTSMSVEELRALPATVNLTTAARALGCGRSLAYELARRDQFPCRVLRLGTRYLVPTADLLRTLGLPTDSADHADRPDSATASDAGTYPGAPADVPKANR
jgi:hypothetical protein